MTVNRKNRTYKTDFKEEAVALISEQGYSVSEAANSLGITTKLLYNWKKKLEDKASGKILADDERSELLNLRKENKMLRMEREILKKASAFFAKEMK